MNGKYLLDTNAIINILKNDEEEFWERFNQITEKCKISIISEMEVLAYSRLTIDEEKLIKEFISKYGIINIDESIKNGAIYLRKKDNLKLPDAIICATALVKELILVTDDKELHNLESIKGLSLTDLIRRS